MIGIGKTDTGRSRNHNEDSLFVSNTAVGSLPNLYIVADGMGGHQGGEVASAHAIRHFCAYCVETSCDPNGILDLLVGGAAHANQQVYAESMADPALFGMGTTFTACVIHENKAYIVHIGDSRLYAFTESKMTQLTVDHSYVNEMIKAGQINQEQARTHPKRNVLIRVLGVDESMQADGVLHDLSNVQMLLLCSDGLTTMLDDRQIKEIALDTTDLQEKTEQLITAANEEGGRDNISVILIDLTR